jgi:GT2 family glycosyltransferase
MGTEGVTAVVVRWRGGDEVARCLASLEEHGGRHLEAITLVDSGSQDGGAERLAAAFPGVRLLALDSNISFAWAANQGVAAVETPLVLLLNPDTEVVAGALDRLLEFLRCRPRAAGAVPLLSNPDGSSQQRWQLRRMPSAPRLALGLAGAPLPLGRPPAPLPVPQPAAAAWLIRTEVWRQLGGLDPDFAPAWWEDVDFCGRLARGLQEPSFPADTGFWLVPEAQILHLGGSSRERLDEARFLAIYYANLGRYARRRWPRLGPAIGRCAVLSLALRGLLQPRRRAACWLAVRELQATR